MMKYYCDSCGAECDSINARNDRHISESSRGIGYDLCDDCWSIICQMINDNKVKRWKE